MMEMCAGVAKVEVAIALAGGDDSVSGSETCGASSNAAETCSDCRDKSASLRNGETSTAAAADAAAAAASEYAAIFSGDRSLSFGRQLGSVRLRLLGRPKFSSASSLISEASFGDSGG